jgi:hypothetical protein
VIGRATPAALVTQVETAAASQAAAAVDAPSA